MFRLAEPAWLLALPLAALPWWRERVRPRAGWPTLEGLRAARRLGVRLRWHVPQVLKALALACLVVALARPQSVAGQLRLASKGVAIVVALDRSTTMQARDFPAPGGPLTRLEAARRTLADFVAGRPDDLIGLVTFALLPETTCPPTLDHAFLVASARAVRPAGPLENGTNLGDAVAWGLRDLRAATPTRKVLVLLSDGRNEVVRGAAVPDPLDPEAAARLAGDLGVTLHTIALGRPPAPDDPDPPSTGVDFALLRRMAELGGGRAFAAADADGLRSVLREIDRLETSPVTGVVRTRYREWYAPLAALAVAALTLDRLTSAGRLRKVP